MRNKLTVEAIPDELRQRPQWVVWKGKKIPHDARSGACAASNKPATWASFDEAVDACASGAYKGIGFMFSADDPYVGVDLDKCLDPDSGRLSEQARSIVDRLDSYTEVSPSGRGLHVFVKATLPPEGRKKGGVEMYSERRYFTVTGESYHGDGVVNERQDELTEIHREVFGASKASTELTRGQSKVSDADILSRARSARNGARFDGYWSGRDGEHGSKSEADLALCGQLVFWTRDPEQLDRLFRQSGRFRAKWDEVRSHGRTYGEMTIAKALEGRPPHEQSSPGAGYFELTEGGNGERFAVKYGEIVRYCVPLTRWLIWDDKRWAFDEHLEAERLSKAIVSDLYREAADLTDEARSRLIKHARASDNHSRLDGLLKCARSEPRIPVTLDAFDQEPWLLNVTNGTVDLRSGKIRPHRREDMLTKLAGCSFNAEAKAPTWLGFLNTIFDHDQELIDYVQRCVGYSLTGHVYEEVLLFLHGDGHNGKSTFLNVIADLFGDYATTAPETLLELTRNEQHPTEIAELCGRRLITAAENDEDKGLNERRVKMLCSKDRRLKARKMRADFSEFTPTHKIWIAGNHKPRTKGDDCGLWRRIKLIPFNVAIPETERIADFDAKLLQEAPGILAWAVQGCLAWQRSGLREPQVVIDATANYRSDQDPVGDFLKEETTATKGIHVTGRELYGRYASWCDSSGEKAMSKKSFASRLKKKGFRSKHSNGTVWLGLGLTNIGAR